ncbi:DapH/DapD/GlmU-related protein [Polynucleobacter asymbioticus]|jgi:lipopolysaccharide O-acetyltransferase|uniref:DapH/DapD/GlmU-related protein n=1 Tax=Polynucleobacter asymbioticus TaxID=576611 RepID=UPI0008F8DD09|nr:DapH/DapD/GlmU-related protein [Polynucleobacter asymbioticus]
MIDISKNFHNYKNIILHIRKYSFLGLISLLFNKIYTLIVMPDALLLRRPTHIRSMGKIVIGPGLACGPGLIIDLISQKSRLNIGKNVKMNHRVHIGVIDRVEIGDDALIGSNVTIIDHTHGIYNGKMQSSIHVKPIDRILESSPIIIGDSVWICDNVVITQGVSIGSNSIIGANSVVTKNIPPNVIVAGAPAQIIKKWNFLTNEWVKVGSDHNKL